MEITKDIRNYVRESIETTVNKIYDGWVDERDALITKSETEGRETIMKANLELDKIVEAANNKIQKYLKKNGLTSYNVCGKFLIEKNVCSRFMLKKYYDKINPETFKGSNYMFDRANTIITKILAKLACEESFDAIEKAIQSGIESYKTEFSK